MEGERQWEAERWWEAIRQCKPKRIEAHGVGGPGSGTPMKMVDPVNGRAMELEDHGMGG